MKEDLLRNNALFEIFESFIVKTSSFDNFVDMVLEKKKNLPCTLVSIFNNLITGLIGSLDLLCYNDPDLSYRNLLDFISNNSSDFLKNLKALEKGGGTVQIKDVSKSEIELILSKAREIVPEFIRDDILSE